MKSKKLKIKIERVNGVLTATFPDGRVRTSDAPGYCKLFLEVDAIRKMEKLNVGIEVDPSAKVKAGKAPKVSKMAQAMAAAAVDSSKKNLEAGEKKSKGGVRGSFKLSEKAARALDAEVFYRVLDSEDELPVGTLVTNETTGRRLEITSVRQDKKMDWIAYGRYVSENAVQNVI